MSRFALTTFKKASPIRLHKILQRRPVFLFAPVKNEARILTKNDIRIHYINNHSFDVLKLWGYNKELLKLESSLSNDYAE
jgi:hypothetical protein